MVPSLRTSNSWQILHQEQQLKDLPYDQYLELLNTMIPTYQEPLHEVLLEYRALLSRELTIEDLNWLKQLLDHGRVPRREVIQTLEDEGLAAGQTLDIGVNLTGIWNMSNTLIVRSACEQLHVQSLSDRRAERIFVLLCTGRVCRTAVW